MKYIGQDLPFTNNPRVQAAAAATGAVRAAVTRGLQVMIRSMHNRPVDAYANAAASFIQVGKIYVVNVYQIKVLKIGAGGWVYVEDQSMRVTRWWNTNQIHTLREL